MTSKLTREYLRPGASLLFIQAGHRRTAIEYAVKSVKGTSKRSIDAHRSDPMFGYLEDIMSKWVVETIAQGAYIREYHLWEKDCRDYFATHLVKSLGTAAMLQKRGSFVAVMRNVVREFAMPSLEPQLDAFDVMRQRVNTAKHDPGLLLGHFVNIEDYWSALDCVEAFWEAVASHEELSFHCTR